MTEYVPLIPPKLNYYFYYFLFYYYAIICLKIVFISIKIYNTPQYEFIISEKKLTII